MYISGFKISVVPVPTRPSLNRIDLLLSEMGPTIHTSGSFYMTHGWLGPDWASQTSQWWTQS